MGKTLPTPCARDGKGRGYQRGLPDLIEHNNPALLATPTATAYGSNQSPSPGAAVRPSLATIAPALLPTPTAGGGTGYMSGHHRGTWRPGPELAVQGHQPCKGRPPAGTLLPTPTAADARSSANATARRRQPVVGHAGHTLTDATRLLPTPRTSDGRGPGVHGEGGSDLRTTVAYLPTPRATDGTKGAPAQRGSRGDLTLPSAAVAITDPTHVPPGVVGPAVPAGWGPYTDAVNRWATILGRPAPPPTQPGRHGKPVLAPAFVEWLMGLPEHWVGGLDLPRTVALKLLGNGVVPHQAIAALRALLVRHNAPAVNP